MINSKHTTTICHLWIHNLAFAYMDLLNPYDAPWAMAAGDRPGKIGLITDETDLSLF